MLQSESSELLSLIQTENYTPQRHNQLLETIVYKSIKPREEYKNQSILMVYIFAISVMAILLFRFACKSSNKKDMYTRSCSPIKQDTTWRQNERAWR